MRIEQICLRQASEWSAGLRAKLSTADLVFCFGGRHVLQTAPVCELLASAYPDAHRVGCSTAGEIHGTDVLDESLVITAVAFERTRVAGAHVLISNFPDSVRAGVALAKQLKGEGLRHVFVLSDGLQVNGSQLVEGLTSALPRDTTVTGGLSGDGGRFEQTLVLIDDAPKTGVVSAVGLYGEALTIGYGSMGGWDPFGPERLITRSEDNVLYEVDGQSALSLYKRYLGKHADDLPASGLLYPLSLRSDRDGTGVVRTILSVDPERQSMTFAGDVPEGAYVRLMKANFNRLVDGAAGAARTCQSPLTSGHAELALLISCVGRKMVLQQRIEEEVEAVRDVLGAQTVLTGFYSYGEISPFAPNARCELHNQTMTITTLGESL